MDSKCVKVGHNKLGLLGRCIVEKRDKKICALRDLLCRHNNKLDVDFLSFFCELFTIKNQELEREQLEWIKWTFFLYDIIGDSRSINGIMSNSMVFLIKEYDKPMIKTYLSLNFTEYSLNFGTMTPSATHNAWKTNKKKVLVSVGNPSVINNIIQHYILNELLGSHTAYLYQYDAFFFGQHAYSIVEKVNIGSLDHHLATVNDITDNFLVSLCRKIFRVLAILKREEHGFHHGNLVTENIKVHQAKDNTFEYKISNFQYSSVFYNGVRFHNNETKPTNSSVFITSTRDGKEYYTLNLLDNDGMEQFVTSAFVFYDSFDIYTLFYSLMLDPSVWTFVYKIYKRSSIASVFFEMWKTLWTDRDFDKIMLDLSSIHVKLSAFKNTTQYNNELDRVKAKRITQPEFYKGKMFLKNVNAVYEMLGLLPPNSNLDVMDTSEQRKLFLTANNKLCTDLDGKKQGLRGEWCQTNIYSKLSAVYDWDYCE